MSYTDIAYCDSVLSSDCWIGATDIQKQYAIDMGEAWIDREYSCSIEDPVQTSIQQANALLADMMINGNLFKPVEGDIQSKAVSAGSVSSSKTYAGSSPVENQFSEVQLLLGQACSVNMATHFKTVRV